MLFVGYKFVSAVPCHPKKNTPHKAKHLLSHKARELCYFHLLFWEASNRLTCDMRDVFFPGKGLIGAFFAHPYYRQDVMITMFEKFLYTQGGYPRGGGSRNVPYVLQGFLKRSPWTPLFLLNKNGHICLSVLIFTHANHVYLYVFYDLCKSLILHIYSAISLQTQDHQKKFPKVVDCKSLVK